MHPDYAHKRAIFYFERPGTKDKRCFHLSLNKKLKYFLKLETE